MRPSTGGQKIGVNLLRMGPGLHRCHTRDLSAVIDIAGRDDEELESAGMSVFRSVITPSCQMKPWAQLNVESKSFPITWPRLLMPVAKEEKSPGRVPRLVRHYIQ